ncbi:hypothetical protein CFBP6600_15270 [Xanthomonas arboricola pv. corylina]|uniref:Uncharacterized protein n=1 Tax=Xanthomonas arboricola pv. corylina TaxID=487821 RepID=A0A8D6YD26_9XANT|nr:hypothetical protein CFBP6600_15270 [Xanthomonas arboricola pv. corylina]CAE6745308.1 hypothetical protein CFBP6600_15270 [Xanthomonas arboricola pv. corylina]CAE6805656.1 hypothetical protein CFBP1159_29940 [Xanthomonas arboricola pv. corylina]CAE6805675.1 hypothetical protein CFBP1159_29940 [Xanthomonas arboricola pv. corylina]
MPVEQVPCSGRSVSARDGALPIKPRRAQARSYQARLALSAGP